MSTVNQRSRQQRALAQRERELLTYMESESDEFPEDNDFRNVTTPFDKASKAKADIDNLKRKLSHVAA